MNTNIANHLLETDTPENPITTEIFEYLKTITVDGAKMFKTWNLHDGHTVAYKAPQVATIDVKVTKDNNAEVTQNKKIQHTFSFTSLSDFITKFKKFYKVVEPPKEVTPNKKERATGKQVYVDRSYSIVPKIELYAGIKQAITALKKESFSRGIPEITEFIMAKIKNQIENNIPKEYKVRNCSVNFEVSIKPKLIISGQMEIEIEAAQVERFEDYLGTIGFRINK